MEKPSKPRKEVPNVTIDEHLKFCQDEISEDEYLVLEEERVNKKWCDLIKRQGLKCYYCETDLRILQQLIINGIIRPRKRGKTGYSGLHFELDHKNANKNDNEVDNLVASCYYCNNDKSDTFSSEVFRDYFGKFKNISFKKLFEEKNLVSTKYYRHDLKGKKLK